jgi:hypothetical protein
MKTERPVLEKTVKAAVRKRLTELRCYQYWPVPTGLSKTTIDVLACYRGVFFGVECKRPGGKLTLRQQFVIEETREAGAIVFVIDNTAAAKKIFEDSHEYHRVKSDKATPDPV